MDIFHLMRHKEISHGGYGGDGIVEIKGIGVFLYISYGQFNESMKHLLYFIISAVIFTSCHVFDSENKITIEDKYSIKLPSYVAETTNLNEDASLQYKNTLREFYVIVIDESMEEFGNVIIEYDLSDEYPNNLQGYSNLVVDMFAESISNFKLTDSKKIEINGLSGNYFEIEGVVDDYDIYYNFVIVKGNDTYYQILTWTLLHKKENHKTAMHKIINSFMEL